MSSPTESPVAKSDASPEQNTTEPTAAGAPGVTTAAPGDAVPPAPVETPTAAEELLAFGGALAKSAAAEWSLSVAAFVRATVHGLAALFAMVLAWATAMVALTLFLVYLVGTAWAFTLLAAAHLVLAGFAWKRHLVWQKRVGFPRTRAVIATVAGLREPPP
jgi:hypothetical protein